MAKEKNSSVVSTPPRAATKAKPSTSRKTASQNRLHVVGGDGALSNAIDALSGVPAQSKDLDQEIRLRAYQIFCERGGFDGAHEDDWLRAEQEVRGKYEKYGT